MISRRRLLHGATAGAAAAVWPRPAWAQVSDAGRAAMASAATSFLAALSDDARRKASFDFGDKERLNWHYVPRGREGVAFKAMPPPARAAAHELMKASLSAAGYGKAVNVIRLEGVLRQLETFGGLMRDPENYLVTVFGSPGPSAPWGWRLEGHHLSLNVALAAAGHITATPFFLGSHPATVASGPHKGLRPLGAAEDLARQLMAALSEEQRRSALIAERSFGEIVASPGRERDLAQPAGLPLSAMDGAARNLVEALVDRFVGTLAPDLAAAQRQRVIEQELGRFRFAWAGPLAPGQPHYFRVHGPVTLIEHDNTQNNANHIHSVWRDLAADFGNDALAEHYRRQPHR